MKREAELRNIYSEILRGFSTAKIENSSFFIKHLTPLDYSDSEVDYLNAFDEAVKNEIPTKEQKLELLDKEGSWTKKQEDEIKKIEIYLSGLNTSKSKQVLLSHKAAIQKEIDEQTNKLNVLYQEKISFLYPHAEMIAEKRRTYSIIKKSFFKDKKLEFNIFEEDEDLEISDFIDIYNKSIIKFIDKNIKSLSILQDILQQFLLCNETAYYFFGKPVINLSHYQAKLFHYIKYHSSIFKEFDYNMIPEDIRNDSDKLIDWFEVKNNIKKLEPTNENNTVGLVGASKEDLKAAGLDKPNKFLQAAKAKGKASLDINDFMAIDAN